MENGKLSMGILGQLKVVKIKLHQDLIRQVQLRKQIILRKIDLAKTTLVYR